MSRVQDRPPLSPDNGKPPSAGWFFPRPLSGRGEGAGGRGPGAADAVDVCLRVTAAAGRASGRLSRGAGSRSRRGSRPGPRHCARVGRDIYWTAARRARRKVTATPPPRHPPPAFLCYFGGPSEGSEGGGKGPAGAGKRSSRKKGRGRAGRPSRQAPTLPRAARPQGLTTAPGPRPPPKRAWDPTAPPLNRCSNHSPSDTRKDQVNFTGLEKGEGVCG